MKRTAIYTDRDGTLPDAQNDARAGALRALGRVAGSGQHGI